MDRATITLLPSLPSVEKEVQKEQIEVLLEANNDSTFTVLWLTFVAIRHAKGPPTGT